MATKLSGIKGALAALCIAMSGYAASAAPSLGDLRVPASRVPSWYAFDETPYQAARSWPEVDATCSSAPCASGRSPYTSIPQIAVCRAVSQSDFSGMNCQIASAPARTVLYLPAGSYGVSMAMLFGRSEIVVRGAGRNATILRRGGPGRNSVGGDCGVNDSASLVSVCGPNWDAGSTTWTAGYTANTRTVSVGNASLFPPGRWILLRMDGDTACQHIDKPLNNGAPPDAFVHIAKVESVSGSQVTFDRGLRMNYSAAGCTGHEAVAFDPVEKIGIESLQLTSNTAVPVCGDSATCIKFPHVAFAGAVNSWIVDSRIDRAWEMWSQVGYAARIWVQGNDFDDLDETIAFNTEGIYVKEGAVDIVFENNTCKGTRVCQKIDNGAEGIVTAYNYMRQDQSRCERAYMNHGHYNRENLFEGNDVDCEVMLADSWWGRNGPRITAYRNRNVSNQCQNLDGITVNEDGNAGWVAATELNVIGNTSGQFYGTPIQNQPACPASVNDANFASLVDAAWLEKNAWRVPGGTFAAGTGNNRSCGTGPNDTCPGSNFNTSAPHASWSGNYPTSLYQAAAPTWWCQEACAWSARGIGAFGDDFNAGVCKLPAQLRAEGRTCTPLTGSVTPPPPPPPTPAQPPAAPILL